MMWILISGKCSFSLFHFKLLYIYFTFVSFFSTNFSFILHIFVVGSIIAVNFYLKHTTIKKSLNFVYKYVILDPKVLQFVCIFLVLVFGMLLRSLCIKYLTIIIYIYIDFRKYRISKFLMKCQNTSSRWRASA